jgi:uncharacterized protein (TIGR03118 family)
VLERLEERGLPSGGYARIDLASDVPGLARVTDPNLVNPWGVSFSPTGPFWFADNRRGTSDLLDGRGEPVPLVVTIPGAGRSAGTPTGTVFNGGPGFVVPANGASAPARFLFAAEDGTISGWSGVVDPARAVVAVDNSSAGAVYKGLALAADQSGLAFLYAADFGRGEIDVFDQDFRPVARPGAFRDPGLPDGFAPFNIATIDGLLLVTYARQDEYRRDDVTGPGSGFIDVYDASGDLLRRFASRGALDSPWGLAVAPADFGPLGGALLVGNAGDGRINAYDPDSGAFLGPLAGDGGTPFTVPALWALTFGNGHEGGAADTLFFTAGAGHEQHGLFGAIQPPGRRGADTAGPGTLDPHAPGEPADYPLPPRGGPALRDDDPPRATAILLPVTDSSLLLVPTLSTVPPSRAPAESPAAAAPVVVVRVPLRTDRPPSDVTLVPPPDADPSPPANPRTGSLALAAFLDVHPSQTLTHNPAAGHRPKFERDTVGARRSSVGGRVVGGESPPAEPQAEIPAVLPGAERGPQSPPLPGEGDEGLGSEQGRPEPVGDRPVRQEGIVTHDRGWKELLGSLLVTVSVSAVYVLRRGHRPHGCPVGTGQGPGREETRA